MEVNRLNKPEGGSEVIKVFFMFLFLYLLINNLFLRKITKRKWEKRVQIIAKGGQMFFGKYFLPVRL